MNANPTHRPRQFCSPILTLVGAAVLIVLATAPIAVAAVAPVSATVSLPSESAQVPDCSEFSRGAPTLGATADPEVTQVPGGGAKYSYDLPGDSGEYMTVNEPPEGFDPLHASDAELQAWGFPPRPSNAAGLDYWRELVGSYDKPYVGPGCRDTKLENKYIGEFENDIWSGYVDTAPNNQTKWHAVMGTYYAPSDHGSCEGATVSSWVGLGGWNTGRFMQTGTTLYRSVGYREAWVELWSGNYQFHYSLPNFPFESTNYIRLYAGYNRFLEIAYYYITNDHTGQTILTEWHIGPQFYDGSTAEWIDEAPSFEGVQGNLLNFDHVDWYSNRTQNEGNEVLPIDAANNYFKTAPVHGNHKTQWPGSIWNHENFTDFYYTCK